MYAKFIIPVLLAIIATSSGCKKTNEEHDEAINLEILNIDFSALKPGEYSGYYAGGMCGWRENECLAIVDSVNDNYSRVITIKLISSAEDRPQSFFDELYQRVIDKQSLQVDVISGATLTSKAHLKAIEDALLKSEKKHLNSSY